MADDADEHGRRRGRYKKYLRHYNPYKFEAARRKNRRLKRQKGDMSSTVSPSCNNSDQEIDSCDELSCSTASLSCNRDPEINSCEDLGFSCEESTFQCDVHSSEATQSSDEQMPGISETTDLAPDSMFDVEASDEELSTTNTSYTRFLREDDDVSLDSASEYEDDEDIELPPENCESKTDDTLYSGAPLTSSMSVVMLLTFVMKHKLTHEAFKDLLSVIEAHCPRPNNCKTSVKKLLEFVTQAKGDIEKHYFCNYCKAYFGQGTGNCNICGQSVSKDNRFFIQVPVEKQLQTFFTGKIFVFYIQSCYLATHYDVGILKLNEHLFQHVNFNGTLYNFFSGTPLSIEVVPVTYKPVGFYVKNE